MNQERPSQQSVSSDILDEIVATQKKYFMMYINNKSAQLASNLESDVKKIISNCVETEINDIISTQINKVAKTIETNLMAKLEESKMNLGFLITNLENNLIDKLNTVMMNTNIEKSKIKELENKMDGLQLTLCDDLNEYFNNLLSEKMQEYTDNIMDIINTNKNVISECQDNSNNNCESIIDENKDVCVNDISNIDNSNIYNEEDFVLRIDTSEDCEKNAIIKEIKNTLHQIDEIKLNIIDSERNRILRQIKNHNMIDNTNIDDFNSKYKNTDKPKSISQTLKRTISDNLSSTLCVNKYCTFLLTTMLGLLVVSQFV